MSVTVRAALAADAAAITELVRRSITQLCSADHRDDPALLQPWLSNKTVENVTAWINSPRNHTLVAEIDAVPAGVAVLNVDGEVLLNYVDPAARFRGVSAALLNELEHQARALGLREVRLESTLTARRFYEERGYRAHGEEKRAFDILPCRAMVKRL
jgi:GNAT superfamily N-acetyltransferase